MAVLAVGIGANTAIFSVVNGVLLRPLPFTDARRLVAVETTTRNEPDDTAYPDFADWRAQTRTLDRLAAYTTAAMTLTGAGEASSLPMAVVTSDLFPMLGVPPLYGRVFADEDDKPGAPRTAILSEGLWTRRFGRDSSLVGRSITLDGEPFTVVGIMPARFEFPIDAEDAPQLWTPVMASRFAAQWATQRNASFLNVIGRLRTPESGAAAQAELSTIAAQLGQQYERNRNRGVLVRPFQDVLVEDYRLGLIVLFSSVTAVLLIACANVANLLLARGSTRRRELAVRAALGASRGQVVRQLLGESVMLSVLGGAMGAALAFWAVGVLVRMSPLQIPRLQGVHVDSAALLFTTAASILTGMIAGLAPAFQLSRSRGAEFLRDGERGGTSGSGSRLRHALAVAELALSIVLLASAGLLARSLVALQHVQPGFAIDRAVSMQLLLPGTRYPNQEAMRAFYRRLRAEVRSTPGVTAAALTTTLPLSGSNIGIGFTIAGRPVDPANRTSAPVFSISPEYLSAMGIRLIKGRNFTDRDNATAPDVIIVSESFAAKYWPGEDVLGRRMTIGYNDGSGPREVVGLVADVKNRTLSEPLQPQMYTPYEQTPWPFMAVVIRTAAAPEQAGSSLRAVLARVDPMMGPAEIRTLEEFISRSIATPRFTTFLLGSFAALAVMLAGFGLFSVMAYSVAQRRREIGIRMALGAQPGEVRAMIVRQAVAMGISGMILGILGAFAATRVLRALLYGVTPNDPLTFAGVCVTLVATMLAAAYLPARRATQVDPLTALRAE
jgi:putative ABC transport system permease protein